IQLLQKRRYKLLRIKFFQLFPIELAPIHHAPAAQVEKVGSDERRLGVISENVGVISLRGGNALPFFDVLQRPQQIAVSRRLFEQFLLRGCRHAPFQTLDQIVPTSLQNQPHVSRRFRIAIVSLYPVYPSPHPPFHLFLPPSPLWP